MYLLQNVLELGVGFIILEKELKSQNVRPRIHHMKDLNSNTPGQHIINTQSFPGGGGGGLRKTLVTFLRPFHNVLVQPIQTI